MKDFDKYLRSKAAQEKTKIPEAAKKSLENALCNLPEKENKIHRMRPVVRVLATAACFIFIMVFLLPNLSASYAEALEKVPVIGDIVRVVTIRNYVYSDDRHELDVKVPEIEDDNSDAADYINKDVAELTNALVSQFYKDLEITGNNSYGSIHVDYKIITNTDRWFTLKLSVSETSASSNSYYKFYHIDKLNGKIATLSDLYSTENASEVITAEIKRQMREIMEADEGASYWIDDSQIGEDFASVDGEHNFYWNENGELVIVFDKYEVGPGSMGTPEFVIGKKILEKIIKSEYLN